MLSKTLQQLWKNRVLRRPCQSPSLPQWHNGRCVTRCSGREESSSSTLRLTRREPSAERKLCGRPYFRRFDPTFSCGFDRWTRQGQSFQRVPFYRQTTMTMGSSPRASSRNSLSDPRRHAMRNDGTVMRDGHESQVWRGQGLSSGEPSGERASVRSLPGILLFSHRGSTAHESPGLGPDRRTLNQAEIRTRPRPPCGTGA